MEPQPSLDQVRQICQSHETAKKSNAELALPNATGAVNKLSSYKKDKQQGRNKTAFKTTDTQNQSSSRYNVNQELRSKYSCLRCGDVKRHKNGKCPAINKQCKFCSTTGHFDNVCFKALREKTKATNTRKTSGIIINNVSSSDIKCPTIDIDVSCINRYGKARRSGNITILPDSGSEITAIGVRSVL